MPRYITTAVVAYCIATYGSYKYTQFTKAQTDLRDVKDQKVFLKKAPRVVIPNQLREM